jgi:8-oxo-dGTP diphosphatase
MGDRKLVVAALCTDARGRVLLTQRLPGQPMGGLWELPGGKVEPGEAPVAALARELSEELGCAARVGAVYDVVHHGYTHFELVMIVYHAELLGTPTAREVAACAWVAPHDLITYEVLPADVELLAAIARRGAV